MTICPFADRDWHPRATVPLQGVVERTQPEPGFPIAGTETLGQALACLTATRPEDRRASVAEPAGGPVAGRRVCVEPDPDCCGQAA